jgi:hypothetical protein
MSMGPIGMFEMNLFMTNNIRKKLYLAQKSTFIYNLDYKNQNRFNQQEFLQCYRFFIAN